MNSGAENGSSASDIDKENMPAAEHEPLVKPVVMATPTLVQRDIHQDHHHTTVAPLAERNVLPVKHEYKEDPATLHEVEHDDPEATAAKVAAEQARFKDTTTVAPTMHTTEHAPAVIGEHVHHHIHETIQPVVQLGTPLTPQESRVAGGSGQA